MTQDELNRLVEHWPTVIKTIHPEIDVVVKGEPDSVKSLLANWHTGNATFRKPTESELLSALESVEWIIEQAKLQRQAVLDLVNPAAGKSAQEVWVNDTTARRVLIGILLALGAIDEQGLIRPSATWISHE